MIVKETEDKTKEILELAGFKSSKIFNKFRMKRFLKKNKVEVCIQDYIDKFQTITYYYYCSSSNPKLNNVCFKVVRKGRA